MAHQHFNNPNSKSKPASIGGKENDLVASANFPTGHQTEGNQSITKVLHQVDSTPSRTTKVGVMIQELNHEGHLQQEMDQEGVNFVPMTTSDEGQEMMAGNEK